MTTAWTPGSQTRGSACGPAQVDHHDRVLGPGPASAASTSPVVRPRARGGPGQTRRCRRRGPRRPRGSAPRPASWPRASRAPPRRAPTRGSSTPRSPAPVAAGSPRPGRAGRRAGRAPNAISRRAKRRGWPASATAWSTIASPAAASASRERAQSARRSSRSIAATCGWAAAARRGRRRRRAVRATAGQVSEAAVAAPRAGREDRPRRHGPGTWPPCARCSRCGCEREVVICAPRCAPEAAAAALACLPPAPAPARGGPRLARPAGGDGGWLVPAQPRPRCAAPARRARAGPGPRRGLRPARSRDDAMCLEAARAPSRRAGGRRRDAARGCSAQAWVGARARPGARGGPRPARAGPGRPAAWRPRASAPGGDAAPGAARRARARTSIAGRAVLANVPRRRTTPSCWPASAARRGRSCSRASARPRCRRSARPGRPVVWRPSPSAWERGGFCACGWWAREPGLAHLVGADAVRARHQPDHPADPALPGPPRVQRHRRDALPRLLRRGPRALDADPRPALGPDRAQGACCSGRSPPWRSRRRS